MSMHGDSKGAHDATGGRVNADVTPGLERRDDLISVAARDLTAGRPSPQLRYRVRSRIARTPARRMLWPAWVGLAGVAAAVLALFIMWSRPQPAPDQQIAVAVPQVGPADPRAPGEPIPTPVAAPDAAALVPVRPTRVTRPAPAIEPIDPLVIGTPAGVMPMELEDLQIEPLQIE
jgi:hypothetical protein